MVQRHFEGVQTELIRTCVKRETVNIRKSILEMKLLVKTRRTAMKEVY